MNKSIVILLLTMLCTISTHAQFLIDYNPSIQPKDMQYFTPVGNQFVGDCIPFYHDGTYYLYWLLDEGHHSALNGLGAHQWVVSTTKDLKNWEHHPIALGIDEDWEKSICTGSVAYYKGTYYAFYATRLINENNEVNEQLSYAVSNDGINFEKQQPNPFYTSAPGYSKRSFRDPKVVIDKDGTFHLFVTSLTENYTFREGRGVLVHLTSKDLKEWNVEKPLLSGQIHDPECPDYFLWKGWYYLIYGIGGRTYYVKSKQPYGPWEYPESQALVETWNHVAKTAEFHNDRRIVAGWIPSRKENKDNGGKLFGGNVVLRELIQLPNGDLATQYPEEVIPATGGQLSNPVIASENASKTGNDQLSVKAPGAIGGGYINNLPPNCRITLDIEPEGNNEEYGLYLRSDDKADKGYKLSFSPDLKIVSLRETRMEGVDGLDKKIKIDIVMKDDIIDVCIDGKRCMVNRMPESKGEYLWLYARQGIVKFSNIKVFPIL